jgi:hypothetical protein
VKTLLISWSSDGGIWFNVIPFMKASLWRSPHTLIPPTTNVQRALSLALLAYVVLCLGSPAGAFASLLSMPLGYAISSYAGLARS